MKRELLLALCLAGCAHGPLRPASDYGECRLVVIYENEPTQNIRLANLPFPPGKDFHEGLWCSADTLQGLKEIRVNGESWKIYFWEDDSLHVEIAPVKKNSPPVLFHRSVAPDEKGCERLRRGGEIFNVLSNIPLTVSLHCDR